MSARRLRGTWRRATVPAVVALAAALGCVSIGLTFDKGVDIPVLQVVGYTPPGHEEPPPFATTFALDVDAGVLEGESYSITSVQVASMDVWIHESSSFDSGEDGLPDDFAFFDSVEVYIEADVGGEIVRTLVASVSPGDEQLTPGSTNVSLEVTGAELVALMSAPGGSVFTVDIEGTVPPDDVAIAGMIIFSVSAEAF